MGIPLYFRYIAKKYPEIIIDILKKNKFTDELILERYHHLETIHHLFLDMNCLIHPACREVLSKANKKLTKKELEIKMLKSVRSYLSKLVTFVKPTQLLYVSIDGPAPKAKMVQQHDVVSVDDWDEKK